MSDIVSQLAYALGNHHWGRSSLLEEAKAEILRLRRENSTLSDEVERTSPVVAPIYRGKHLLTLTDELEELRA